MERESYQLKKWRGIFGQRYTNRTATTIEELDSFYNKNFGITRMALDKEFLGHIDRSAKILEVGSNIGNQLLLLKNMGFKNLYSIEPQEYAFKMLKKRAPGVNAIKGNIFDVPFKDGYFDIVFTSGVLIHINPKDLKKAMMEIYRCTKKYIWGYEYFSRKYEEVRYRQESNLLWKANFPSIYLNRFPNLKVEKLRYLHYKDSSNIDVMFLLKKSKV